MSVTSAAPIQNNHTTFEVNYSFWAYFYRILAIQVAVTLISSIFHYAKYFFQPLSPLMVFFDFYFFLMTLFWLPCSSLCLAFFIMLVRFRQKIMIRPEGIELQKAGKSLLYPWEEVTEVRRGRDQSKVPFWLKRFSHRRQIQLTLESKTGVLPKKVLLINELFIKNNSQLIETLKQYVSLTPALQSFFESEQTP